MGRRTGVAAVRWVVWHRTHAVLSMKRSIGLKGATSRVRRRPGHFPWAIGWIYRPAA